MRAGVLISAVSHCALVALALLGTPKLFDAVSVPSIEVDLIRPEEVEQPPEARPEPEKVKTPDWLPPSEKPAPWPEAALPSTAAKPDNSRQALLTQQALESPAQGAPKQAPSIFDPAAIPMLMDLPNSPEKGFDSEATTIANLSADERAAFRAHLRKCWKLGDVSNIAKRVVLRVYLRPDARLAGDPVLIEASASRDGPLVLQAARQSLKACQPFVFLPPDKYAEWKVLDLSFTPRDMAGG